MTFIYNRTYSESFNLAYALHFSWPDFLPIKRCNTDYSLYIACYNIGHVIKIL